MRHDLEAARDLAHQLRFAGEGLMERPRGITRTEAAVRLNRRWGLEVSAEVTPHLFDIVQNVGGKFGLGPDHIRAFVHPAAVAQAQCVAADGKCIVEVTSALVEQLDGEEQAFVIGHELGHFLLDHHYLPLPPDGSLGRFRRLRAREISADRIGLFVCNSPDAAIRASMKVFSGLSSAHLRFDSAAYIRNAFSEHNRMHALSQVEDSHPSFAVRARCMVHMASILKDWGTARWKQEFAVAEERVARDFSTYGEAGVEIAVQELREAAAQWIWVSSFITDGRISAEQLDRLADRFGAQFSQSVRSFFFGMARSEVKQLVERNLAGALAELNWAFAEDATQIGHGLIEECERGLGLASGSHPARSFVRV